MNYINIIIFSLSLLTTCMAIPPIYNMLWESKMNAKNYEGKGIPTSMGLSFIFVQIINVYITMYIFNIRDKSAHILYYLLTFTLIGLVGLIDDFVGDKTIKGFKGHISIFLMGKITTGSIKAGVGLLSALMVSLSIGDSVMNIIVDILIIVLFTNLMNIFDLRPGRSIKVFAIISVLMLLASSIKDYDFLLYSFYGILIIYSPLDFKAKVMMGDVGSNALGFTLGVYCTYTHTITMKITYLIILIIIHLFAEKFSFSNLIARNRLLSFIDNLGR